MKKSTAAQIVDLLSTLLVSAPKAASAAPPPRAAPIPPSFDFWASTTRIRKRDTKIRKTVRIARTMPIGTVKKHSRRTVVNVAVAGGKIVNRLANRYRPGTDSRL
jgi:hypothetical protein